MGATVHDDLVGEDFSCLKYSGNSGTRNPIIRAETLERLSEGHRVRPPEPAPQGDRYRTSTVASGKTTESSRVRYRTKKSQMRYHRVRHHTVRCIDLRDENLEMEVAYHLETTVQYFIVTLGTTVLVRVLYKAGTRIRIRLPIEIFRCGLLPDHHCIAPTLIRTPLFSYRRREC